MKKAISIIFALILIAVTVIPAQAAELNELIKYPEYPEPYLPRDYAYSVSVTQGENSIDIPVYNASRQYDNFRNVPEGDYYRRFCEFAFSGDPVTVKVRVNIDMTCYEVLPSSKNFPSAVNGNEISITLTKPEDVVVRLNDDLNTILTIFAESPEDEADIPAKGDENVIYCDAGLDNITGGEIVNGDITLTEGQTLYLAPGALVQARLIIEGSNTTVKGRGALLDPETTRVKYHATPQSYMLKAKGSGKILDKINISGIKLLDSRSFNIWLENVTNSTISDIKVLSNQVSTDGITLMNQVVGLTVTDSYFYVNDNVFVFGGWKLDSNVFKNLTIGSGYALFFPQGGSKSNTFENLDIFHIRSFYKATMTLSKAETTQNIYCKNIYAADVPEISSFINCKNQNSGEKNIYFENVSLPANKRTITFYTSETYPTSNMNFNIKNLWFGTEQLTSLSTDYSQYANFVFDETSDAAAAMAGSSTRTEASHIADKIYVGSCLLRNYKALPQTIGGTMYVDAVGLLESLGYSAEFEGGVLTFNDKYTAYSITADEYTASKNALTKTLTNPVIVQNGSALLPVTCLTDLGITDYTYNSATKSLNIKNVCFGDNLLTNSGFEQGTTYDWVTFEFADLYSSDDSYTGEKSLKVSPCVWSSGTINNYDYGVTQYVKDILDKNGAGKYHLEAMVKLDTDDQRFVNDDGDGDGNPNNVADVETIRMGFTLGGTSISYVSTYNETLRNNSWGISGEWQKIELDVDISESFLKNCNNLYFFIGSKKTEKKSFFIDDVKLIKEQDEEALYVDANMKSGAAIRLNSQNGIRFCTLLDSAKIANMMADGATVELGTLIAPKDLLGENELTLELDSAKYTKVLYEAFDESGAYAWHDNDNGYNAGQIAGSIVGIKESGTSFDQTNGNVARDFVGRGYVKVTKDGKTAITYADYANGDIANNTRSLAYVANALKNDTTKYSALDSAVKTLVEKWASKLTVK